MSFNSLRAALCVCTVLSTSPAFAQETNTVVLNGADVITVIGTVQNINDVSGAITFIGPEELALQNYSDINRVLRAAPGVNIQEEEGYGLRPNIGLRGSGADRSSKVLIMEDGVLMAPAPYAAPAAYYFPMTGRMNAVEVTKGPATVKYGPNTTAGAIHLFSTPIPDEASGHAEISASDLGRIKSHAWAGSRFDAGKVDIGFMLETYQDHADGFKKLETGNTGFDVGDYVAKLGFFAKDGSQSLEFKFQYKDEESDETYLGLTQSDYEVRPLARYNASQLDKMVNDHKTYQLTHNIDIGDWHLTTIGYRTEFARNWFKLDKFDNSQISGLGACNSLNEILTDPIICNREFLALAGPEGYVSPDDVLGIRANNRSYYAQGIQTALGGAIEHGAITHNLVLSARYHKDEVDRFQEQDQYRIDNTRLIKTTDNAPGTQANRLSDAKAFSLYFEDRAVMGDLTVTAGLRYENVDSQQRRWNTPNRTIAPDSSRENSYDEWLPALSAKYDLTDDWSILGGVHRGFSAAPVSSRQSTDPERSTVYEGGFRYSGDGGLRLETIGFFNDYSNLLGECTNSSGSNCDIGDAFNAGQVDVKGLEVSAHYDLADALEMDVSIPLALTYTYTDTEIKTSFSDSFWGDVTAGSELPYVPKSQITLSAGINADGWGVNGVINTVSAARNTAGPGSIPADQKVGPRTLVDLSAFYEVKPGLRLNVKAENAFDETYVAARRPYGIRPGKPREVFAGIALDF